MTYKKPNIKKLQAECDAFNAKCPVGGEVSVKIDFQDEPRITTTISEAQILSGHSAVVWMAGISGCYLLSHVTPIQQEQREAKPQVAAHTNQNSPDWFDWAKGD